MSMSEDSVADGFRQIPALMVLAYLHGPFPRYYSHGREVSEGLIADGELHFFYEETVVPEGNYWACPKDGGGIEYIRSGDPVTYGQLANGDGSPNSVYWKHEHSWAQVPEGHKAIDVNHVTGHAYVYEPGDPISPRVLNRSHLVECGEGTFRFDLKSLL